MSNGGGVILPYTNGLKSQEIFGKYLAKSSFKVVSNGAYGIAILCSLNTNLNENEYYKMIEPGSEYDTPVKILLLKFCFVGNEREVFSADVCKTKLIYDAKTDIEIEAVTTGEFVNEINTQTEISLKTMSYLKPLCPSIVYAGKCIVEWNEYLKKIPYLECMLRCVQVARKKIPTAYIGVVAMEYMSGCTTLYRFNNKETMRVAINTCRYALLKLALETGYNHSDFHKNNIMICKDRTYFNSSKYIYRPIIIDFGRAHKLPINSLKQIQTLVNNKQYTTALSQLCTINNTNSHIANINYASSHYGWVCGNYDLNTRNDAKKYAVNMDKTFGIDKFLNEDPEQFITKVKNLNLLQMSLENEDNAMISDLFVAQEKGTEQSILAMDIMHSKDPNRYPLLPLSNQLKNKVFEGIIGGRKHIAK